ncbi:MAG: TonB-dependent receptor [Bacteroidia bacterium]|nr:TonB-dependent receptor [Bacteroidia bacterium]
MRNAIWSIIFSLIPCVYFPQIKHTLSGYIYEKGSMENLPGVTVHVPKLRLSASSNAYGFYSLTLPEDSVEVYFIYAGYKTFKTKIYLKTNIHLNVELGPEELAEVEVTAEENKRISEDVRMGHIEIPVEQIKQIPALLGEKDVLKVIQLLPGVQKGTEGSAGIYVRGGGPDQNLIILDEAPVYNANHLFGFFSVFNGDALKSVELIKGGFPARYGGRLSSVIDLQMKDGNKEKMAGEAGIGIISSRLTLEGPIKKNKSSFIVSGRRTYIDALIYPFMPKNEKGGYFFYDLNAKANYFISDKNRLYVSGYFGRDKFYVRSRYEDSENKAGLQWGNATATVRWNHLFSSRLFSNLSFIFTNYQLNITSYEKETNEYWSLNYRSLIRDAGIKYNFDFMPSPRHYIRFGATAVWHYFYPQALVLRSSTLEESFTIRSRDYHSPEAGIFFEDDWEITDKLKINPGFRMNVFMNNRKFFYFPEPRFSARYMLTGSMSAKASYALMNQFLHLLTNTGLGLPTDLWVPATSRILPQRSQQVSAGLAKDLIGKNILVSVEGYYKWMDRVINYKEGSSFFDITNNDETTELVDWQDKVVQGRGWSYGVEIFLQKKKGRFTGWIGYTLSWTWQQFDSLNFGKKFHPRYDRRHDISVVGIYKINERLTLSGTWVFGTGNAITLPRATYPILYHYPSNNNYNLVGYSHAGVDYGEKNSFRMAPYHRLDLSIQHHKKLKRCERTFEFSIYNAYNRMNPFFYYIEYNTELQKNELKQVTLFPVLPSLSWTFKF